MKDKEKTKEQLIEELAEMRQRIAELETSGTERVRTKKTWTNEDSTLLETLRGILVNALGRKWAEKALDIERQQLLSVFDSADEPIYMSDPDTYEVLYANRAIRNAFGDVAGQRCYQAFQGLGSPCPFCTNDRIFGENVGRSYIWEFQNPANRRWYRCIDKAIHWPDGRLVRYEMAIDITERKRVKEELKRCRDHLEESVKERTAELEAVNAELSQYAYVVSHDVRAPLRAIRNYADFLRKDLEATLDDDQESHLGGLGRAVREAEDMVEDLLELSRVGQLGIPIETVEVGAFLQELLAILSLPADAEIVMADDWPTIDVEPVLLGQIFQNLITNAIKFNRSPRKRVELGWRSAGEEQYELFVRDNGIGIDPRYHEQIFRVFERLHAKEEYEGTGIGLAIVEKATGKLGGSVRVESRPGEGSTFFVTLPKTQKERQNGQETLV